MDAKSLLSKNIAKYRKRCCMTQSQLAEQMGVTTQAVSKWEQGICAPDITLLPELAAFFEVNIDELFNE
ncbi:MAG: helix-turn-helix transcriptional regulator [Eubacterium sp.]|nr:helix-turn-helix transcriptional regulator [Eubacterium sp.]